jgi:C-terminal processing protease CtpA/Prc
MITLQVLLQVANDVDNTFSFRETAFNESNASRKKLEEKAFLPIGSRGRWGIGIRDDPANPAAPVVVAIRKGSPAERGGLQIKDRIYEMDQTPIIDQKDLMRRLSGVSHDESVRVLVSRRGQFLELTWTE